MKSGRTLKKRSKPRHKRVTKHVRVRKSAATAAPATARRTRRMRKSGGKGEKSGTRKMRGGDNIFKKLLNKFRNNRQKVGISDGEPGVLPSVVSQQVVPEAKTRNRSFFKSKVKPISTVPQATASPSAATASPSAATASPAVPANTNMSNSPSPISHLQNSFVGPGWIMPRSGMSQKKSDAINRIEDLIKNNNLNDKKILNEAITILEEFKPKTNITNPDPKDFFTEIENRKYLDDIIENQEINQIKSIYNDLELILKQFNNEYDKDYINSIDKNKLQTLYNLFLSYELNLNKFDKNKYNFINNNINILKDFKTQMLDKIALIQRNQDIPSVPPPSAPKNQPLTLFDKLNNNLVDERGKMKLYIIHNILVSIKNIFLKDPVTFYNDTQKYMLGKTLLNVNNFTQEIENSLNNCIKPNYTILFDKVTLTNLKQVATLFLSVFDINSFGKNKFKKEGQKNVIREICISINEEITNLEMYCDDSNPIELLKNVLGVLKYISDIIITTEVPDRKPDTETIYTNSRKKSKVVAPKNTFHPANLYNLKLIVYFLYDAFLDPNDYSKLIEWANDGIGDKLFYEIIKPIIEDPSKQDINQTELYQIVDVLKYILKKVETFNKPKNGPDYVFKLYWVAIQTEHKIINNNTKVKNDSEFKTLLITVLKNIIINIEGMINMDDIDFKKAMKLQ